MLADPVSAGIEVCRLAVTSRPIGTRIAQAMRTVTMPMTRPVMPLRFSLMNFRKFIFGQNMIFLFSEYKYRLRNRKKNTVTFTVKRVIGSLRFASQRL